MIERNPTPQSAASLRKFGGLMAVIFAGAFGTLLPLLRGHALPIWPWALAAAFALPALAYPLALRPVHRAWMLLGLALGYVNSRIILGALFFLVITPISFVLRAIGSDPMARKLDKASVTYRKLRPDGEKPNMEAPY